MNSNGYSEEFDSMFKILLATDNHLGVHENDGVRALNAGTFLGEDSFNTFEEILQIARDRDVDFILLGGDLFDQNVPSTKTLQKCTSLLRKYTMGDKPITVSFDSNPEEIFNHCDFKVVNYLDPNLNISIPVYSIHGNHDDPSGLGQISVMDNLATSGMINYFGKWTDLKTIKVKPILLSKGSSKVALYGLSNIRDARLSRLFASRNVQFDGTDNHANRFNILVLHQNRVERPSKLCISEDYIPDFFDFVLWGHEHTCRIDPEENVSKGFVVVQPGSSVSTSLREGEAVPKHVAILKIIGKRFDLEKIKLKTVRPFVIESYNLNDWNLKLPSHKRTDAIQDYVDKYIRKKMLPKAKEQLSGHPLQPTLPLIRLRLEITEDYQQFNTVRFSQRFSDLIANACSHKISEVVKLKRIGAHRSRKPDFVPNMEGVEEDIANEVSVEDITVKLLEESEETKHRLSILLPGALTVGVKYYIEKDDKAALEDIVYSHMSKVKAALKEQGVNEDNLKESIKQVRDNFMGRKQEIEDEARDLLSSSVRHEREAGVTTTEKMDLSDPDDDFGPMVSPVPKRGKGSRGGRRANTGRGRGRGKAAKNNTSFASIRPRVEDSSSSVGTPSKKPKLHWVSDEDDSY